MPRIAKELKPVALSKLPPGRHAVGGVPGLLLQVQTSDGKDRPASGRSSWVLQSMIAGKRRQLGLGPYPEVGLSDAREKARQLRQAIRDGRDPIAEKVASRSAIQAAAARAVTFKKCAEDYITAHEKEWKNAKHGAQWGATLETYAFPVLGTMFVADITTAAVLKVLEPIWATKTETATRVRGRIETVLDYATSRDMRAGPNPARWKGHLDHMLASPRKITKVVHHPALGIDQMQGFVQRLRTAEGQGARALEFLILTAARQSEVRDATWAEIKIDAAIWTIPASKMKSGREHRVPLCRAAIDLLQGQSPGAPDTLVFRGTKERRPLSDGTLGAVIERLNIADNGTWVDPRDGREVVPHGFRSTFRDWAGDRTAYPREVVELALAHAIESETEAAYRRGDALEKRRGLMEAWAQFIVTPPATGKVVPIGTKAA